MPDYKNYVTSEELCNIISLVIINVLDIHAVITCVVFRTQETDYQNLEIGSAVIFLLLFRDCVGVAELFVEKFKFLRVQKECR